MQSTRDKGRIHDDSKHDNGNCHIQRQPATADDEAISVHGVSPFMVWSEGCCPVPNDAIVAQFRHPSQKRRANADHRGSTPEYDVTFHMCVRVLRIVQLL